MQIASWAAWALAGWVAVFGAAPELFAAERKMLGAGPASWANDLRPIAPRDWSYDRAAQLLERAGFSGTPEEIARLAAMTPAQAVSEFTFFPGLPHGLRRASPSKAFLFSWRVEFAPCRQGRTHA